MGTSYKVNIAELKSDFPKFLRLLSKGLVITLCKRNQEIAEIHPISARPTKKRVLGKFSNWVSSSRGIDKPLPEEISESFFMSDFPGAKDSEFQK